MLATQLSANTAALRRPAGTSSRPHPAARAQVRVNAYSVRAGAAVPAGATRRLHNHAHGASMRSRGLGLGVAPDSSARHGLTHLLQPATPILR